MNTMSKSRQDSGQVGVQDSGQDSGQVGGTLNKLDKTKLNETSSISFYMNNINPLISPHEVEILNSYCEDLSDEIVTYAIQDAIEHNAKNMKYIKKILDRYIAQGLSSVEQIKAQANNKKEPKSKKDSNFNQREYKDLSYLYANGGS